MSEQFVLKRNDRSPSILYQLLPVGVNLTGATIVFNMKDRRGVIVLNRSSAFIDGDPTLGIVGFNWPVGSTILSGEYFGEFEVTFPDTRAATFPSDDFIIVLVPEDIA